MEYVLQVRGRGTPTGGDSSAQLAASTEFKPTLAFESAQRIGFLSQDLARIGPPGRDPDKRGISDSRASIER